MNKEKLVCTNCGESYDKETKNFRCDKCGEPIELEEVKEGKISDGNPLGQTLLERYKDFYPSLSTENNFSLNEGFTSLVSVDDMAKEYGISGLFFKNETQNPTWSFKDRGTVTGVLRAMNLGYKKIGTVSTGNMATSVAAYGARAGLDTYILVKRVSQKKTKTNSNLRSKLIEVEGDYSKLYDESLAIGHENDIYFINSDVPYRVEGYKTMAFEICEQLGFEAPDYVIVPTSAGGDIRE